MTSQTDLKLRVLTILRDNLNNPQPQVVGIEAIADELQMSLHDARQLLLRMDQTGIVKIDLEANYALITSTGMNWVRRMSPVEQYSTLPTPVFAYPQQSTII